jgi:phage replication initiation protein
VRGRGVRRAAAGRPDGAPGPLSVPPVGDTGVEVTAGLHWYRGVTTQHDIGHVLDVVREVVGDEPVFIGSGRYGYTERWLVGQVQVMEHPDRSDMGVLVEADGAACDALGAAGVARIALSLELRASRLDLALDGCGFTPAMVRDAWRAGDVRTRAKVPPNARADREWRTCHWHESVEGDTFTMGSRGSQQYARCYDRRGPVRFELELKDETAARASEALMLRIARGDAGVPGLMLGLVRRFVDFVDAASDSNASRRALLPWWASFLGGVERATLTLARAAVRTVEDVRAWVEGQVAPSLAVVSEACGISEVFRILRAGRQRWRPRHRAVLGGATG